MAKGILSVKRTLIEKANTAIVVLVSIATFVFVFSLFATKVLVSQAKYQDRIISAKRTAVIQLKTDLSAAKQLQSSYVAFVSTPNNVIGGSSTGTGQQDGDNSKIVLDALPSVYDFPSLTTGIESLLSSEGVTISNINGTDEEVSQANQTTSTTPQPVVIPFQVSVSGSYTDIQNVISAFERSIRPIQIQSLELSGSSKQLSLTLSAQTYYQPAKLFNIGSEVVK